MAELVDAFHSDFGRLEIHYRFESCTDSKVKQSPHGDTSRLNKMKESTFKKYCLVIDEWFINGFNGVRAYMKFYSFSSYDSADKSFRDILEIPRMKEYKEMKSQNKSEELGITLSSQLKLLSDIINSKEERATDKIAAIKEQNKLLALYREHNEQKKIEINTSLTKEEAMYLNEDIESKY